MKRWIITCLTTVAFVLVCLTRPAFAFLGIGDIVFDPAVYAQVVEQVIRLERQYVQLVQTYQMVRSQYQHMQRMAQRVPVNMAARYRAVATPWRTVTATNTYGTTGRWISGINSGSGVRPGYAEATEELEIYGGVMANIPADQLKRVKTSYGTVELTDGANIVGMQTIGHIRSNAPAVEKAIQGLEDDSLSADPDMNTEIALLNKLSAAGLISIRNSQDTNKLLAALAEQQILQAKRIRDAEARAIRNHIRFRSEGRAVMAAQAAGASDAMRAWRMR